jgi:hypothetical protein
VWTALGREPADGEGVESILPELQAVLEFTQELNRRFASAGVDGIGGALELYRRMKAVLDGIPDADIERMRAAVESVHQTLARVASSLEEVRRLKTLVRNA